MPKPETPELAEVRASMAQRMASGEDFTQSELYRAHLAWVSESFDPYWAAHHLIQAWRRRGWIAFRREHRKTIWSLTEDGKAAHQS